MKTLYITQMLRWGLDNSHHYIVGIFDSPDRASYAGEVEQSWRGGKYTYEVIPMQLNPSLGSEKIKNHINCQPDVI